MQGYIGQGTGPQGFIVFPGAFEDNVLKQDVYVRISAFLSKLRGMGDEIAFAVRSSALGEDTAQASYAGEFETILDVQSDREIFDAIHEVRRSRISKRVKAYKQVLGLDPDQEMSVVVQVMVPAELSGVLFTADPVTGNRRFMTGNFILGTGEKLVSGEIDPEAFTLTRPSGKYRGPALLKRFARRLSVLAGKLEMELGNPQDIEWAITKGDLYILQSRPITSLMGHNTVTGEWNESRTGDFLWATVNFGEAMPGVMTPMTWGALQSGPLGKRMKFREARAFGNIGGRVYLNISMFASVFHLVGMNSRKALKLLEGSMHIPIPDNMEIPLIPCSRLELFRLIPQLIADKLRQKREVKSLPEILPGIPGWCRGMREKISEIRNEIHLATLFTDVLKPYIDHIWSSVLSSATFYVDQTYPLRVKLTKRVGPDDADALISGMSSESELLASIGPVMGLSKLLRGEMTKEAYAEHFGHRSENEFELSIPRYAENPDWLEKQIHQFDASDLNVAERLSGQRARIDAAQARFEKRCPRKANAIRRKINHIARLARLRENTRSELARLFWIWRIWIQRAGNFTDLGDDVFFLTPYELLEVLSGDRNSVSCISARRKTYERYCGLPAYPPIIRGRFDPFQWADDPHRSMNIYDSQAQHPADEIDRVDTKMILGAPGSAGRAEGIVRCLTSPDEGNRLQTGEVLVTLQTNIAWTLLFPRVAAIITDVGAPLSHAAIVARELGIPAVVGCGDATARLKTGNRVRVDGGLGIVQILDA